MKIKVIITGQSVHEVGYRVFLLNRALTEGLDGFSASNEINADGNPLVIVFAEGDEESIQEYSRLIKKEFPPHALVQDISIEPYERRVIKILDYMHLVQVEQLDKGIPAILSIKSSQEQMLVKQDQMLDIQDQMLAKQDQMLVKQEETNTEIHALRSDLKTELNERFNKIEHELAIMKEALYKSGILA